MLRKEYISGSAGLLAVGAVLLVLGYAFNPLPQEGPINSETVSVSDLEGPFLLSGMALLVAAVCLTLGVAALLSLMAARDRVLRVLTGIVFAAGTIGMAGYAMVMVFVRALVLDGALSLDDMGDAADDPAVVGAVALTALPELFRGLVEYRYLLYGITLLLLIRFRPQGLLGTI